MERETSARSVECRVELFQMHTVAVVEVVLGLVALFVDWANVVAFVVQVVAARVVAAVVVVVLVIAAAVVDVVAAVVFSSCACGGFMQSAVDGGNREQLR